MTTKPLTRRFLQMKWPGSTLQVGLGLVALACSVGCGTCEGPTQKQEQQQQSAAANADAEPPIPIAPMRFVRQVGPRVTGDAGVDM